MPTVIPPGDSPPPPENEAERTNRNFDELLQELRVMQTGVQLLTGFLLTLPFQARFADLDAYQRVLYLVLVALAVLTTGILIAPVSIHRALFRRGYKRPLVLVSDRLARLALVLLALVVTGTAMLAFDVVVSRAAGIAIGVVAAVALLGLWLVVPWSITHRIHLRHRPDDPEPSAQHPGDAAGRIGP